MDKLPIYEVFVPNIMEDSVGVLGTPPAHTKQ